MIDYDFQPMSHHYRLDTAILKDIFLKIRPIDILKYLKGVTRLTEIPEYKEIPMKNTGVLVKDTYWRHQYGF